MLSNYPTAWLLTIILTIIAEFIIHLADKHSSYEKFKTALNKNGATFSVSIIKRILDKDRLECYGLYCPRLKCINLLMWYILSSRKYDLNQFLLKCMANEIGVSFKFTSIQHAC